MKAGSFGRWADIRTGNECQGRGVVGNFELVLLANNNWKVSPIADFGSTRFFVVVDGATKQSSSVDGDS